MPAENMPFYDPDNTDWCRCFSCGSDSFEIAAPAPFGRVKLKCKKCGYTFSKPRRDIQIKDGVVKLMPSRSSFAGEHRGYLPSIREKRP